MKRLTKETLYKIAIITLCSLFVCSCGQKGPLKLSDEDMQQIAIEEAKKLAEIKADDTTNTVEETQKSDIQKEKSNANDAQDLTE